MVLRAPICYVIGARSRECPVTAHFTGIHCEFFVIWIPNDSHVNYALLNGFRCTVSYRCFRSKEILGEHFNSEICYRNDLLVIGL